MRFVKIAIAFIASAIVGAFCFLVILATSDGVSFRSLKAYVILSGSMEPEVPLGSIVVVRPTLLYFPGDIISFKPDPKNKMAVTHRITQKYDTGIYNSGLYETKGDANNAVDSASVKQDQIVGKVFLTVPYIGYAAQAAKTKKGFIFLIIVPSTIIIYEELKTLKKELAALLKKLKSSKTNGRALIFVPMIASIFVLTSHSQALFSDKETSSNNSFQAGAWTTPTLTPVPTETPIPTPTPTPSNLANHIVISEIQINGDNANQDFVELYNPTNTNVNLNGWQIRRKTSGSGGSSEASLVSIGVGKSIPAYGFFLWANEQGGYSSSVGADVSNDNNLSENYSIVLKNASDEVVDSVAWGNNTYYIEGTAISQSPATNESFERKAYSSSTTSSMTSGSDVEKGNAYDSQDNISDFIVRTTSQPQNSGSLSEIP